MKPSKQIIVDFIVGELKQGKTFDTCLKLCGTKWNLSRSTFNRRWKEANIQHKQEQDLIKQELAKASAAAAVESLKKQILTADERKEFLSKLVKKETKVLKVGGSPQMVHTFTDKDGNIVNEILPTELKIKAIAELNKMEGDYAPLRTENKNLSVQIDLSKFTEDELKLYLQLTEKASPKPNDEP
jgi:hypothetical protein